MINEYLTEIIATIVILTLLTIYIIIKIRKHPQEELTPTNDETIEESETTHETEDELTVEDEIEQEDLTGSEEGDFGEQTQEEQAEVETPTTHTITKRDVPAHPKVTKQNFSEFSGTRILVAENNLIN